METKIIAAFPGMGKTYATKELKKLGLTALDSDSSIFSWEDNKSKARNPEWPDNYIKHIQNNIGKVNYIFVSTHKEVRDALRKVGINFQLVVPSINDAYIYRRRYQERGNSDEFVQNIMQNWDKWLNEIKDEGYSYTVLYYGGYLMDHIRKEYLTNITSLDEELEFLPVLKVKKLTSTAKLPTQAHVGDLFDIYSDEEVTIGPVPTLVHTGLAFDVPNGYQLRIYNRSSNPLKNSLILSNGIGIVDTGYKGEVMGIFHCCQEKPRTKAHTIREYELLDLSPKQAYHTIHKGDKIMQMELVPLQSFKMEQVAELNTSNDRGGGFGSTGK